MGCGCKQDKVLVERKLQARKARKRQHELRKAQSRQLSAGSKNAEAKNAEAKKAAFDEYIRTRQPIGYQDTTGGRKALYAEFVFPQSTDQNRGAS